MKPYCFLDWDGVGNTVAPNPQTGTTMKCMGFRICIPKHFAGNVERLMESFDMVWLTTWEHHANAHFNSHFGWDEWPVVEWKAKGHHDHPEYKLEGLEKWFESHEQRPWCFIDDDAPWEITELQRKGWEIKDHLPQPYSLIHPYHRTGLTMEETDEALKFAAMIQ